ETCGFEGYRLIVAPMLYMLRPGVAERLEAFVREGGTLLCTTFTGRVDRDDLCFLGGFPGPLRDTLGIWIEETDALMDGETNAVAMGGREYACLDMCDLIHAETAEVVGEYASDFYAGMPAVTRNSLGRGAAWYLAARGDQALLDALTKRLVDESGVRRLVDGLPEGVQVTTRGQTLFVMNFNAEEARVALPEGVDMLTGERMGGPAVLRPLRVLAIKTAKGE
ncbi:MAG: beta-galactosidase, partial [Clostridiales bacterium]|nr:beta-galactosidase [Clostridiales bacterium]